MQTRHTFQQSVQEKAVFVRLLLPLIAGILLQLYHPVRPGFLITAYCFSFLSVIFFSIIGGSKLFFGMGWTAGLVIQFSLICLGRLLIFVHQDRQMSYSSGPTKKNADCLVLQIVNEPVQKQKSYKCLAYIRWFVQNQDCFREDEKILVYFNKKPDPSTLSAGSLIVIHNVLRPIENFKSSDFDYKRYCHLKHIYAQVFLKNYEYLVIGQTDKKTLFSALPSLRKKILEILKNQVPGKSENSLLEALLVGFTDDLDPVLLKSYADTGVIHIIAISGLHLALICHILEIIGKGVRRKKTGKWTHSILIAACLWFYSLLSGGSPSVIRAAMMFSMVLFARNILRENTLFNSLAASAFLLLCFDPYWIQDTGFQLSYAAVLGLGLFSNPVRDLIPMKNKSLQTVWNSASISIAAQILTTPISIYYFHQFPVYFLFANLLAVPLSSLVLAGGILLCILAPAGYLAFSLGWLLGILIRFLNGFIHYVSCLPGAVFGPLNLNIPQLIMIYFMLFCFCYFLKSKEKRWLFIGLTGMSIFQILHLLQRTLP